MFFPKLISPVTRQQEIYTYITTISRKEYTENMASSELTRGGEWFIIGTEIIRGDAHDLSGYFNVFFLDAQISDDIFDITSEMVFTVGILKIDSLGNLSIVDSSYAPMDVNVEFEYSTKNKLRLEINDMLLLARDACVIM